MGGWISENQMGFCRIVKWFFHCVGEYERQARATIPEDPENGCDCEFWMADDPWLFLSNWGFDDNGNRPQLIKAVQSAMKCGIQLLTTVAGGDSSQVYKTICSLSSLVIKTMQESMTVKATTEVDRAVRPFLSDVTTLHGNVYPNEKKPLPLVSTNLLCLLIWNKL
jgi:hypothetical protein